MLPTFVIGLREGLEAALIVGIVAAFLRQQGRKDLLRAVFLGVGVAVLLCLAVGIGIKVASGQLPQKQQEGLETVIGLIAVAMVTYMVVWMKRHSRELKGQLEGMAARAMDGHSRAARAMVAMAFLAVLREGLETAVFLLAAFNESDHPSTAASGAVLGLAVAILLGYGIYRGGVKINLSKFFRATGVVLVLVAAGLVVNAIHTAHEAGWVNFGQQSTVDLTWLVEPGSVQASLLTGMLGLQPRPVVVEVIGWLAYLVPVLLYIAWAQGPRAPRQLGRALLAVGGAFAVGGVLLAVLAPTAPDAGRMTGGNGFKARATSVDGRSAVVQVFEQSPACDCADSDLPSNLTLSRTGSDTVAGVAAQLYTITLPGHAAATQPEALSIARILELNRGRLPLGLRPGAESVPATYAGADELTVVIEPRTRTVLDVRWRESVTATLHDPAIGEVPLAEPVATGSAARDPADVTALGVSTATALSDLDRRGTMTRWARGLGVVALTTVLVGLAVLAGNRRKRDPDVTRSALDKPLVHS
jgi:high-affinity iron transporter